MSEREWRDISTAPKWWCESCRKYVTESCGLWYCEMRFLDMDEPLPPESSNAKEEQT